MIFSRYSLETTNGNTGKQHDSKAGLGWSTSNTASSSGTKVAVEVHSKDKGVELDAGFSSLFARHRTEWYSALLFKNQCCADLYFVSSPRM